MDAQNKEKIYEELRNYHLEQFPDKVRNPIMKDLRIEFGVLEDKIIAMLLSLVNGKAEYADPSGDIQSFDERLHRAVPEGHDDEESMNLFATKIAKLREIVEVAKNAEFKLRPAKGFGSPIQRRKIASKNE
jgi:hypothetical protein